MEAPSRRNAAFFLGIATNFNLATSLLTVRFWRLVVGLLLLVLELEAFLHDGSVVGLHRRVRQVGAELGREDGDGGLKSNRTVAKDTLAAIFLLPALHFGPGCQARTSSGA